MLTTASILYYGNIKSVRRKITCSVQLFVGQSIFYNFLVTKIYVIFSVLKIHFLELNQFFPFHMYYVHFQQHNASIF